MKLLDSLTVFSAKGEHYIELYHGDLTDMPPEHAVDIVVASAFPNDYSPTPRSLIGALDRKGISLAQLSRKKAADLRESFSCWMSQDVQSQDPGIQFKRILCFEPLIRGNPPQVVSDIFQSLMPFIYGVPPISAIAMPLVATGDQGFAIQRILEPLLEAAVNWLALGLPVKVIKIVERSEEKASELKGAFAVLKQKYRKIEPSAEKDANQFRFDYFISYAHQNSPDINFLYDQMKKLKPDLRVFLDRKNLNTGAAWQQELYDALDDCRKVIAVYSPEYLKSKVCKEEYNIALLRHRESESGVLAPFYLYSTKLPSCMQLIQFVDCREGNPDKIKYACKLLME
jgi:TIR domain-containing protein